jgi:membrane-bound lytic murein transglycosylase D
MGLTIKSSSLWILFLAMLGSAAITDRLLQSGHMLHEQNSQNWFRQILPPPDLEIYHLLKSPDIDLPPVNSPEVEQPASDAVPDTDLWTRMRSGFVFPSVDQVLVRTYIDEYTKHPFLLKQILQRGEPYLFHILARLEQEALPAELALLPVVESAFNPFATSPAGAAGIWQFMSETAAYVGLDQDWWYDGRRDIIASTDAALDYLNQLNKRFDDDWFLTLAAYNAGSARVRRAIRENRDAGKPTDFWHLSLPAETRSYVPKLIALRTIVENPRDYNITLPTLPDAPYFSTVKIRGQIELKVAAKLAGIPLADLQRLNPGYDRSITPPGSMHTLLFPKPMAPVFRERISRLPHDQRVESIRHRIRMGDNLSTIAQQYHTTVSALRKVNRLKGSKIIAGKYLIVPTRRQKDSVAGNSYIALM